MQKLLTMQQLADELGKSYQSINRIVVAITAKQVQGIVYNIGGILIDKDEFIKYCDVANKEKLKLRRTIRRVSA